MISSTSNPHVKRIRRLRQKKYRLREGTFYTEGLRVVLSAVESQAPIDTIYYSRKLLTSEIGLTMIDEQSKIGVPCIELAPHIFQAISEREHPVGLSAIIRTNWSTLSALPIAESDIFVALLDVSEPGNLGTIIRTMDAVAASGLLLVGSTVDPYHPSTVKASMGTIFNMPHVALDDYKVMMDWAHRGGLQTIATSANAQIPFDQAAYRFPLLLLLGNEGEGLPADVMATADFGVAIPMRGSASSLNLAVAAGIILVALDVARKRP